MRKFNAMLCLVNLKRESLEKGEERKWGSWSFSPRSIFPHLNLEKNERGNDIEKLQNYPSTFPSIY